MTADVPSPAVDQALRPGEEPRQTAAREVRLDIQLLRALAILLVLLHHARFPIPAGFLGVDIFFVISGFLMTGLIDEGLETRRFRFGGFYARRTRRLLPAAYATLVVTALIAPFLVDSAEYGAFVRQLGGSFAFVANIVLWKQSNYFGGEAVLKPLLHMWSLAVEEQFYLVLPVLRWLCPARWRFALAALLTLASGALCWYLVGRIPTATFYLLPTRAWELGLGVIVALAVRRGMVAAGPYRVARAIAAIVLAIIPFAASEIGHPGLPALIACLATAVLLVPGLRIAETAVLRPFKAIGDRSYSLYLVHWPVFAFANHVFLTPVPGLIDAALVPVCLVWMELQYRLVEQPLRTMAITRRALAVLVVLPLVTVGSSFAWSCHAFTADTPGRTDNGGLAASCDYRRGFAAIAACQTGAGAGTMVWGDSFAMAIAPGIAQVMPGGTIQATRTACGPFLGIAPVDGGEYPVGWAASCIAFNRTVLDHLAHHPEIETVVLSSALTQYVPDAEAGGWSALVETPHGTERRAQSGAALEQAIARTAAAVRALGKRVVLVAPPPSIGFDVARCLDRAAHGQPTIAPHGGCGFTRADYAAYRRPVLTFLAAARARRLIPVLAMDDALCAGGTCRTRIDGVLLYRDIAHLSTPGAKLLARKLHWAEAIRRTAS